MKHIVRKLLKENEQPPIPRWNYRIKYAKVFDFLNHTFSALKPYKKFFKLQFGDDIIVYKDPNNPSILGFMGVGDSKYSGEGKIIYMLKDTLDGIKNLYGIKDIKSLYDVINLWGQDVFKTEVTVQSLDLDETDSYLTILIADADSQQVYNELDTLYPNLIPFKGMLYDATVFVNHYGNIDDLEPPVYGVISVSDDAVFVQKLVIKNLKSDFILSDLEAMVIIAKWITKKFGITLNPMMASKFYKIIPINSDFLVADINTPLSF